MKNSDELIIEIHGTVMQMKGELVSHINNPIVHQVPPCEFYKGLVFRLWGVLVLGLTALGTTVWHLISGGKQ